MDLAQKIPYFTLDVISHVGLGQPFGDLLADADVNDYLKSSEEGLRIGNSAWAMGFNWLRNAPLIGPAISPSEKDTAGFGKMMAEARRIVDARKAKSTEDKSDMLASFIRNGVEGDDLFQEVFEQILAGSDTTAGAIRIVMLYVITHPRVYKRLQEEVDDAVESGKATVDGVVSDAEARKLPYLCAVVREGMRVSHRFLFITNTFSIWSSVPHVLSPYTEALQTPKTYKQLTLSPSPTDPPPGLRHLLPHNPSIRCHRHHLQHHLLHPWQHPNRLLSLVHAPHQPDPLRRRRSHISSGALAHH
jgi:hypothetical protein